MGWFSRKLAHLTPLLTLLSVVAALFTRVDIASRALGARLSRLKVGRAAGLGWLDAFRISGIPAIAGGVGGRTALFSRTRPGGVFTIDDVKDHPREIWFLDSTAAGAGDTVGHGGDPDSPFATLSYAFSSDLMAAGDVLLVMPDHAETLAAAAALDIAGVTVRGLGEGNRRPTFVAGAIDYLNITGNDVTVEGLIYTTPTAAFGTFVNIDAARVAVRRCRFNQGVNAVDAVTITANGELPTLEDNEIVVSADGPDSWIKIEGVIDRPIIRRNVVIGSDGTNAYDDGVLDFNSVAVTNPVVKDNVFLGGGTATTVLANISAVVGGSFGPNVYGGSATNADNVSAESELGDALYGAGGIGTFPAAAIPADGVSLAEVIRQLYAALEGTAASQNGVATWPTAAAYANNVSIAEVLAYIQDGVRRGSGTSMAANKSVADALGTDGTTVTDAAASVLGAIGADNANNAFASTSVAANEDGSILERLEQLQEATNKGTGTALAANESLVDVLYAANGISIFPAAAAPANGISIAEALREVYDQAEKAISTAAATMVTETTIFTIAGGPIEVLELFSVCVTTNDGTASTVKYTADPTDGAATDLSIASASLANAAAGTTALVTGTFGSAPTISANGVVAAGTTKFLVTVGIIKIVIAVGSTTGTWTHHLRYRPLSRGVTVS